MSASSKVKAVFKPSSYVRGVRYIKNNGLKSATKKFESKFESEQSIYQKWWRNHKSSKEELEEQRNHKFEHMPKFSIVVPLYKTPKKFLIKLVDSIKNQSYENWELVLSDGSGPDSPLTEILNNLEEEEPRIKVVRAVKQLQISDNTNLALDAVTGDFICFGDHDDEYALNALYENAKIINEHPDIEFIYSDEDKINQNGKHFGPHFKSDFNYDMLTCNNYICHLVCVKADLQKKVGGLRSDFDGAQDYDFVLRCVEQTKQIHHIPKILYHWRAHELSTAGNPESKNYAWEAGRRAVQAHYDRIGVSANVELTQFLGNYRTYYELKDEPLISIIIPNKDHVDDLQKCLRSIKYCNTYKNIEIVIVENNSEDADTFEFYKDIEKDANIKVVTWKEEGFNYPKINNFGASKASGDYLLFLNNDAEFIEPNSIREMLSYCQRDDVGAVGAKLFYPDGTIQHAGVTVGLHGNAGHNFVTQHHDDPGYYTRASQKQDLSAVTAACMLVKKLVFDKVSGFSSELAVAYNDIDLCLRIRQNNFLIVYTPNAQLWHHESKSRGYEQTEEKIARFNKERKTFEDKWAEFIVKGDPYYNINLTHNKTDFSL